MHSLIIPDGTMKPHQRQPPCELIIFTRYPEPGKVKTRLIPKLGRNGAARAHRQLAQHIFTRVIPFTTSSLYHLSIYYTGGDVHQMRCWLGSGLSFKAQIGKDLGQRMATAFRTARDHGSPKTVLIGTDCPSIDAQVITTAFDQLDRSDLVIGPTFDGGYYLLGMKGDIEDKKINTLFENISWGMSVVYRQTLDQAEKAGLTLYSLQHHHDIDRPEDLAHFNYNPHSE